jgi:hypothetical protein
MSYILIRCTYDKNLELIQPLLQVIALFVFLVLAPWWPSQESDRAKIDFPKGIPHRGTCVQSFIPITPAATKRAC